MELNDYLLKILEGYKIDNKDYKILKQLSVEFAIPSEILISIYLIETTYRRRRFRLAEYIIVLIRLILSISLKVPLPNYTIGKSQIGLGVILNFFGFKNCYTYSVEIRDVNLSQAFSIIKSFLWKNNSRIFAWRIACLAKLCNAPNYYSMIRLIGTYYNGKLTYGLILEKLVKIITEINVSIHDKNIHLHEHMYNIVNIIYGGESHEGILLTAANYGIERGDNFEKFRHY